MAEPAPAAQKPDAWSALLHRVHGVLQARNCERQAQALSECLAAGSAAAGGGAAAAAACADYAQALQWCEQQVTPFSHPSSAAQHFLA